MSLSNSIYSQLAVTLPYPDADFSGKTVIVTGANTGLGKEAVRHFVRLKAETVIIAVRSIARGEAAKAEIEAQTKSTGVLVVWEVDYSSYASVKAFAAKVASLARVDAVVLNASIATEKFEKFEDNESTITVNVVSSTFLALLLLPILRVSAAKWDIVPVITVVNSEVHAFTLFPEQKTPNSLATLNNENTAVMSDRYQVSKLLQLLAAREIAEKIASKEPHVVINMLNPGLCRTELSRNATGTTLVMMKVMKCLLARSAEEGSRTLVHATTAGLESHGVYLHDCRLKNNGLSKFVTSPDGQKTQKKVWGELAEKLEAIQPGITTVL